MQMIRSISALLKITRYLSLLLALVCSPASAGTLPGDAKEWYFWTNDNVRHYAIEIGQVRSVDNTVIVLHGGFGAEHSYLIDAVMPLSTKYHYVLYDQRGSLRTPAPAKTITLDRLVEDLEQLRKELDLEQVTLLGHSMGTALAYAYLAKHPDRVGNLILVSPVFPFAPGVGPDYPLFNALSLPASDEKFIASEQVRYQEHRKESSAREAAQLKREGLDHPATNGKERTAKWRIAFASTNIFNIDRWREMDGGQAFYAPEVIENMFTNAGGQKNWYEHWSTFYPALQSYKGPLTFIVGTADFIDPGAKLWPLIVKDLEGSEIELIPESGHNIWIDEPELFKRALERALERPNNSFKPKPLRGSA